MKEESKNAKKVLEKANKILGKTASSSKTGFVVTYEVNKYARPKKRRVIVDTKKEAEAQIVSKLESLKSSGRIECYKINSVKTYAEENP